MRRGGLVLALALASCGGGGKGAVGNTAPTNPDSITLGYAVPPVGAKWTEEKTQTLELQVTAQGHQFPLSGNRVERRSIEVLGVSADAVTKARITYEQLESSQKMDGQEQEPPHTIGGKTYVVEAGDPIAVSTEAGPASDAEAAEVRDIDRQFGKPERMSKLLEGKTFAKDEPVDLPEDEIAEAMGDDPSTKVTKMTLTFRGMEGAMAKFDMATTLVQENPGSHLVMDLSGNVVLDPKTDELQTMALDGTLKMSGTATADGTMHMTETHTR